MVWKFFTKIKNLEVIKLDLRNIKKVLLKNFSTVIHLASISNDPSSDLNPKLAWEIGPLATYELLSFQEKKIKNFIYASSGSVYGISKKNRADEKTSKLPLSDYNTKNGNGESNRDL